MSIYNLVSFTGVFLLIAFAWLLSSDRRLFNWRAVAVGLALQFAFAIFLFKVPFGTSLFLLLNDVVVRILDCATSGIEFLFGPLALSPGKTAADGSQSVGFILAIQVLPTIIFFAALMGALYHFKVMPALIRAFAYIFTKLMRISGAESLCVSSNIFVGIESSLSIRPFLERMTRSELTTILTAGMATIASSVLALYVFLLKDQFPTIAGHLISASILSAPAAIIMSKVLAPEREIPETLGQHVHPHYKRCENVIEAIIDGANAGLKLVMGIVAVLIAFLGIVELFDLAITNLGGWINGIVGISFDWSSKNLLGYLFYPATIAIGISPHDASSLSGVIGERLVLTEVVSYRDLASLLKEGAISMRSAVIATYALCGFAHVASLAIFVGGIGALVPSRIGDLSKASLRALLAATLACLLTAAVAGVFITDQSIHLAK